MYEILIRVRNRIISFFYRHMLKPILFRFDPETVHDWMVANGKALGRFRVTRDVTKILLGYNHSALQQTVDGVEYPNPIGLSAGFDKDGVLMRIIPCVGFGFEEVGSMTAFPSFGNPKPRLWRFPNDKSILVHLGLNNEGVQKIAGRLEAEIPPNVPVGTSIAMTNRKEPYGMEEGIADYVASFVRLAKVGSYFTVNISCPNTYQGEPFTKPETLDRLLSSLDAIETQKPIYLKLSPDLTEHEVDAILDVVPMHRLHGFVCSNLTHDLSRANGAFQLQGGLSGKAQWELSNKQIAHIYKRSNGHYTVIGVGGVFSAEDAYTKIKLGALLVELITGMVYEGPSVVSTINQGLVRLLKKDGFRSVGDAVGSGA